MFLYRHPAARCSRREVSLGAGLLVSSPGVALTTFSHTFTRSPSCASLSGHMSRKKDSVVSYDPGPRSLTVLQGKRADSSDLVRHEFAPTVTCTSSGLHETIAPFIIA